MNVPLNDLALHHEPFVIDFQRIFAASLLDSTFIGGQHVSAFEASFADCIGSKHCISCANGTDALFISLKALGVSPGDEVITTAHSWISTSEVVSLAGAKPVFCDIHPEYYTLDPSSLSSLITPQTVGIVPVHLYGQSCNMDEILSIASHHKLWILEDCAQSHLATFRNQTTSTIGDLGTFSFFPGKNLGALGDAGAIVTNSDSLAQFCRLFANHGGKNSHLIEGINSRLDSIQAGFLNVKLPYLSEWTSARQRIALLYTKLLSSIYHVTTPKIHPHSEHAFHQYTILCFRRDELQSYLYDHSIQTRVTYPLSLPFLPCYAKQNCHLPFPVASSFHSRHLSLPIFPEMTDNQVYYVTEMIFDFYQNI